MMTEKKYKLLFSKTFRSEFKKLSNIHRRAVIGKILILRKKPFYPSLRTKKMKGNIGNYESSVNMDIRIIWQFMDGKIIVLLDVGHHKVLEKY